MLRYPGPTPGRMAALDWAEMLVALHVARAGGARLHVLERLPLRGGHRHPLLPYPAEADLERGKGMSQNIKKTSCQ